MKNSATTVPLEDVSKCWLCGGDDPEETVVSCHFFHKMECYLGWSLMAGARKQEGLKESMKGIPKTCPLSEILGILPILSDFDIDLVDKEKDDEIIDQDEIDELLAAAFDDSGTKPFNRGFYT